MEKTGKVYLVGAGPGDPGLITLKGLKLLQSCDAVIYDRLISERLLDYVKEDCEKIYAGKIVGNHSLNQEEINRIIIEKALTHKVVVRLKGGDPFVFGRGGEEVLALKEHGIPFEVIPGITSAIAAATYAGIPITHRGSSQSFAVITGHTAEEEDTLAKDLRTLASSDGTLVILMGIGNLDKIKDELLAFGKAPDTPVAVIANGTTPMQREVKGTLQDICQKVKEEGIKAPALIVIGNVAELDMKSTIAYPLSGVRIGITGTRKLRDKLILRLEDLGASTVDVLPLERIEYSGQTDFTSALLSVSKYHWIVFTSANAVELFFDRMQSLFIDHRNLSKVRFAVIGSGTKDALWKYGYITDLMPEQYNIRQLANDLADIVKDGEKLLIPRAVQGSEELNLILDQKQICYDDIRIYDVVHLSNDQEHLKKLTGQLDYLVLASSSGVHAMFQHKGSELKELLQSAKVVCIGEATKLTLMEYGYQASLMASEASVNGLIECILEDYTGINRINISV